MDFLTIDEFRRERGVYDEAVLATPEVADFCSSSSWILAAHEHIHGEDRQAQSTFIAREGDHWLAFAHGLYPVYEPLESMWCFTCPLIGPSPELSVDFLLRSHDQIAKRGIERYMIGGVPRDGQLFNALLDRRSDYPDIKGWEGIQCMMLHLGNGGVEAYLARRKKKLRRNLRATTEKVHSSCIEVEEVRAIASLSDFHRLLVLHKRSRKWSGGNDIFQTQKYLDFYLDLAIEATREKRLRILVARQEGVDLAYIMGVVFGDTYRGLQMAYDDSVASLGIGNWLQVENMRRISAEGFTHYDLGMYAPYKEPWIDEQLELVNFLITIGK